MRPIMRFLSSRLSGPGLRMWAQQSLGPTPLPAMVPRSTPEVGATRAGFMAFAAVLLLLLIVAVAVMVYDRTRRWKEEKDRITITPARLGRAACGPGQSRDAVVAQAHGPADLGRG